MPSQPINRRRFLRNSALVSVGLTVGNRSAARAAQGTSANDRILIGCMGLGGRGQYLAESFARRAVKQKDCEVVYVCDVREGNLRAGVNLVKKHQGKEPKAVDDFRRMLDDKDVDALVIATPDHWHALPVVWGAQAGKHSYVEKPASHSIWEGRKMVEAARKYNKVVQLGTQTRSSEYMLKCIDYIQAGKMGSIHLVKVYNMMPKRSNAKPVPDGDPPKGFDYEKWLGPAPMRPYNAQRVGNWNWWWDYSGGDIINDGVHQMDLANWVIGHQSPTAVYCSGGKLAVDDPLEAPDTQTVVYDFPKMTMTFELAMWTPYMNKIDMRLRDGDYFCDWSFNATRVEIYGTKEMMMLARHGGGWQAFKNGQKDATVIKRDKDKEWKETHKVSAAIESGFCHGLQGNPWHQDNFLKCIRSGQRPNADIEWGHLSTVLCHLGNISYRVGCQKLLWDGQKETFTNSEEANKLIKRTYRDPWVIKEEV